MLLEICCGSVSDALNAEAGGASRIELNSALSLGGLTPDIGSLILCKEKLEIPVIAMLRPRGGGFCYTDEEYQTMKKSAECLLQAGADGLAFGFLNKEKEVEFTRTKELVEMIHSFGKEAVFHRAFDCVISFEDAVESLMEAKVDRILTSGGEETAWKGADCLCNLQMQYGKQIEILAGSGIRSDNVAELLNKTGVRQVHSSCRGYCEDRTARGNGVSFAYAGVPEWYFYETVSKEQVLKLKQEIKKREEETKQ